MPSLQEQNKNDDEVIDGIAQVIGQFLKTHKEVPPQHPKSTYHSLGAVRLCMGRMYADFACRAKAFLEAFASSGVLETFSQMLGSEVVVHRKVAMWVWTDLGAALLHNIIIYIAAAVAVGSRIGPANRCCVAVGSRRRWCCAGSTTSNHRAYSLPPPLPTVEHCPDAAAQSLETFLPALLNYTDPAQPSGESRLIQLCSRLIQLRSLWVIHAAAVS